MKTKILFIALLIFTLVASSVSADRYVDWQFKYATLDSTGITYTNTPITGVDNIGFVCADGSCNTVSGTLRGGATTSSGVTDTMQLTYPTADSSVETNGYGEYFYKSGYITWEQNPTFWGTNPADPAGPYDVYLSKIASCNAPVDNFNILNDVQPNVPLVIDIYACLDSITYA